MSFLETPRFPDDIAYGSKGGPSFKTNVFTLSSGHEHRNIQWSTPKHMYDVAYGVRSQAKLYSLIEYFHAVAGMAYGFRFKDYGDFKSCAPGENVNDEDQPMESFSGESTDTQFKLVKVYTKGAFTRTRRIYKPVDGTILVAVDGVVKVEDTDYAIDYTTGLLTFSSTQTTSLVTWGGEFDVPVRFEQDDLPVSYEDYLHGTTSVKLVEDKLVEGTPPAAP